MRGRALLALCVAAGFLPAFAFADWVEFIPRPLRNGAFVDTYSAYERDSQHTGQQSTRWDDTFLRERLTVYSDGYSYHPRFLLYHFSVSGAARQEDYEASFLHNGGWQYSTGFEYNTRLLLLPEHPYNVILFAARYEPVIKELSVVGSGTIENTRGALFRYHRKPYFLTTGVTNDLFETRDSSSETTRFTLEGEYVKEFGNGDLVTFNAGFLPAWFSNSVGLDGSSTEYLAGNLVRWKLLRLYSAVTKDSFDQSDPSSGEFNSDHLGWYELLTAHLPWNFKSDASYRYQSNDSTSQPLDGAARTLSDTGKEVRFAMVHRLYESLDSTYAFGRNWRTSPGGSTTTQSHSLAENYTKLIPRGRLVAGISLARSETDSQGEGGAVIDERHQLVLTSISSLPQEFPLSQQNVQESSIMVYLQSPVSPNRIFLPPEAGYYTVNPAPGNTFTIRVINLPPEFVVSGEATYEFLVSYTFLSGTFNLRSDAFGGTVRAELFGNFFSPYFSYLAVRSKVLSGLFPGTLPDSTVYTAGVVLNYAPLRLRGEYQELDWDVGPYRSWRADAEYVGSLNPTTSLYATVSYLNKYYFEGQSGFPTVPYTEESETAGSGLQKRFFSRKMTVSAGGSYTHLRGLVDADAYAFNGSVTWTVGKVDLIVGGNGYEYESSGTAGFAQRRDHERFYLSLRRRLF